VTLGQAEEAQDLFGGGALAEALLPRPDRPIERRGRRRVAPWRAIEDDLRPNISSCSTARSI
jgi:hypothetical protein